LPGTGYGPCLASSTPDTYPLIPVTALPPSAHQDELAYKKQQLQSAAATGEALKSELAARRAELDNLDSLGVKIQEELADIERQRGLLQADMDRYGRSSEIRREVQQQLSELGARQAALNGQRDAIKVGVLDGALTALRRAALRITAAAFVLSACVL
jgi:chromosome segregation ATPase